MHCGQTSAKFHACLFKGHMLKSVKVQVLSSIQATEENFLLEFIVYIVS
jgi:hypothetical protein